MRTWFDMKLIAPVGATPGSRTPASARIATDLGRLPKRTTSCPSSREIDATPACSAASRSSATSTRRSTGEGICPNLSMTSCRNAAMSPAVRARASRR